MSHALSQRRAHRHPVGLLIVVGLHVALAAVLLSARLKTSPPEPPFVPLQPIDEPVKPPPPRPIEPPPPTPVLPRSVIVVPEDIPVDRPPETIVVEKTDKPVAPPPVQVASLGGDDAVYKPARIEPRAARIDARAAQCHPEYPAAAQRAGATGSTRIRFTVDALGRIAGSQILHASGSTREHRMLDQAAVSALAQCPVQVGTDEQGRPMGTTTDVEYVWSLN